MDEDAEDISLTPCSSTIGMCLSDDSDDESSKFDAFWCIGGTPWCNGAENVAENTMILWPHCTIIAKSAMKNAMQWSKNHYARSLFFHTWWLHIIVESSLVAIYTCIDIF